MTTKTNQIMADFVFGGIEADETKVLARMRDRMTGLRHFHAMRPLDPEPGQPVTLTVTAGLGALVDRVAAYVTTDGTLPTGERGQAANGFVVPFTLADTRWDTAIWDYVTTWYGEIPAQNPPPGGNVLVQYVIQGWHSQADGPALWSNEVRLDRLVDERTLYGYSVDSCRTPDWATESVIYQIFVDRFAPTPQRWLEPEEMTDFMGGTLRGVIDHLDHIVDLGATVIWLTPIFVTPTYHGYDTTDFTRIDPRFGTEADLRDLVNAAHQRGIRVLMDFVANHVSLDFAPFVAAKADPDSPYRSWFHFGDEYTHGYQSFFNVPTMPKLDVDHPQVRQHLFAAARYWLTEFGVDGYRLDYAAGPSHAFWADFYAACKQVNPDCWIFGEITLPSDQLRTYVGRMDGTLDFGLARAIRRVCVDDGGGDGPDLSLSHFAAFIERHHAHFPQNFVLPSFVDNHDMNRFLWVVGNDKRRLLLGAGLLFAFGGPPILYYGTEVGLGQPRNRGHYREESRHPMLWDEAHQDRELLAAFRRMVALRKAHPALQQGQIRTLHVEDKAGIWLAERFWGEDRVLIAVNTRGGAATLFLPPGTFLDETGAVVTGSVLLEPISLTFLVTA